MAWSQTDINTLQAAIATNGAVKSITFADQTMTFRTLDEMRELLAMMRSEVSAESPQQRRRFAATSKGV